MLHKKISDLDYSVQKRFTETLSDMNSDGKLKEMGVESVCITETLRELSTQMAYYACGRLPVADVKRFYAAAGLYDIGESEAKQIKTKTLNSNHMGGKAVDFAPVVNGKIWWNAPDFVWERMGEIGESLGLKWGGRWKDFKDCPHFEV
ncbi:MAG: M15 family metallopeptidase [Spirochaetaceae bacterium]|nr:M15 family metallopeptidase [Spirochaetaceae bacterium]